MIFVDILESLRKGPKMHEMLCLYYLFCLAPQRAISLSHVESDAGKVCGILRAHEQQLVAPPAPGRLHVGRLTEFIDLESKENSPSSGGFLVPS